MRYNNTCEICHKKKHTLHCTICKKKICNGCSKPVYSPNGMMEEQICNRCFKRLDKLAKKLPKDL